MRQYLIKIKINGFIRSVKAKALNQSNAIKNISSRYRGCHILEIREL